MEIYGDTNSLKASTIGELKELYDVVYESSEFVPFILMKKLCFLTTKINREIAVYINRKGKVEAVCVGDSQTVSLPLLEGRRDKSRLKGLRCIHTHPNESGHLSTVDINSLYAMKFDAMIAIGVLDGQPHGIYAGILVCEKGEYSSHEIYGPLECEEEENEYLTKLVFELDSAVCETVFNVSSDKEIAILVALDCDNKNQAIMGTTQVCIDELEELATTAGAEVVAKVIQKKSSKDSATYIGKGKVEELALARQSINANLIIFDDELSGAQIRNIENIVGVKVIDRTSLILDIFAKRARSKEGKIQVELAQLKYRMPRLIGLGIVLSRLGGGIGTRGPGEKQLETDRRHIRRRIQFLENEIKQIAGKRDVLRKGRETRNTPVAAIVGYTNAGKSTLLNRLCNSDVLVEDKVFATLDPTTRGIKLSDGRDALLVDTVGFIRKLPHQLVESFKSTLEEVLHANLLIHVVDVSSPEYIQEIAVVNELLKSIGAGEKPMLIVYNKIDSVNGSVNDSVNDNAIDSEFAHKNDKMSAKKVVHKINQENDEPFVIDKIAKHVEISALKGLGLDNLIDVVTEMLKSNERKIKVLAPYSKGWVYPYICDNGKVLESTYIEEGVLLQAIIKADKYKKIEEFCIES